MTRRDAERQEAKERLLGMIHPGDTVYTILRHVSRSGMQRVISLVVMVDGQPMDVSWMAARAIGCRFTNEKHYGIVTGGCGMDMGFHLVYSLGSVLWRDGFECIGDSGENRAFSRHCPSNDHSNGDRNYAPHHHRDGGYALRHAWL